MPSLRVWESVPLANADQLLKGKADDHSDEGANQKILLHEPAGVIGAHRTPEKDRDREEHAYEPPQQHEDRHPNRMWSPFVGRLWLAHAVILAADSPLL
jgi:hypothetical protein